MTTIEQEIARRVRHEPAPPVVLDFSPRPDLRRVINGVEIEVTWDGS